MPQAKRQSRAKSAQKKRQKKRLTVGKTDTHNLIESTTEQVEMVSRAIPVLLDGKPAATVFFTATLTAEGDVAVSHGYTTPA